MGKLTRIITFVSSAIWGLSSAYLVASEDNTMKKIVPHILVNHNSEQSTQQAPDAYFTGTVYLKLLFPADDPLFSGGLVTFTPGARTAWHTHPKGQMLLITEGIGLVQEQGGPIEQFTAGDTVWIPSGVKHWHGAAPNALMSHIATAEKVDNSAVVWLEKVTEQEYTAAERASQD